MPFLVLMLLGTAMWAQPAKLVTLRAQAAEAREQNRSSDAIRLYRQALELQPAWAEGWWYLGTLLYDQNSYAPARDALAKLVQLEPKSPSPAWALLGLSEFETKDYAAALRHLDQSFVNEARDNPFARATRYHAALLLTKSGQFEVALKRLAEISAPDTETPDLVRAIGVAALRVPVFATEIPEEQYDFTDAVGHALFDRNVRREREAEARFQALLTQYPRRPQLHYLHGESLLSSDPQAAIGEFQKELELTPRHVPALLQIAFEFLKEGEPAKALPYAKQASAIEPAFFAAHAAAGQALVELNDLPGGIGELEKARTLAPNSPETHMKLASAYAQAGREQDAKREREIFARLRNQLHSNAQPR
jgi:tetratricopeptide (TPR) repeat protein